MLTVATYLWGDKTGRHYAYTGDDVRLLQRMVKRHLSVPHEFVVITDQPHMFDADANIRAIPINRETHVSGRCFVRLFTFHPDGKALIGERVLQIDLDTVIVGDMAPLVARDENLVLWHNPGRVPWENPSSFQSRPYYNTSMLLHRCGTMPWIHINFDPERPSHKDDQWLLSDILGSDIPYWDGDDGVYRIARADTPGSGVNGALPENARVVFFTGSEGKPENPRIASANPWIWEHRQ